MDLTRPLHANSHKLRGAPSPPIACPELCRVRKVSKAKYSYCGLGSRCRMTNYKNYPPLTATVVEFVQLMSMSLRTT